MGQIEQERRLHKKQLLLVWVLKAFCMMMCIATALLFVAWVRIEGTRLGYDIAVLHKHKQQLESHKRLLLLEIHMRKRPAYLYPLLQERLQLTSATLQQIQRRSY